MESNRASAYMKDVPSNHGRESRDSQVDVELGESSQSSDVDVVDRKECLTPSQKAPSSLGGGIQLEIALSWRNVDVSVPMPGDKVLCGKTSGGQAATKQILFGVSGCVQPGHILAIMGASGAGKSTLLNTLTGRNVHAYTVTGSIRLNGHEVGQGIKNVSAYVQQDDIFFELLTVREQLQFRAMLRMDKSFGKASRMARVEEVMEEMGLQKCANSRIGAAGGVDKGISGGERKRLSFASEALTNPPIMFCDEPTSGLDSFMAGTIVQALQKMARRGRTILCTIHQPPSDVFSMFNQLLLMSEGRRAYMGSPQAAIGFFEKIGKPCPLNYNPADHYILTMAIVPGREEECRKNSKAMHDAFEQTDLCAKIESDIDDQMIEAKAIPRPLVLEETSPTGASRYEASWVTQFRLLFWRAWVCSFRNKLLFKMRVAQMVIVSCFLGLVYLQIELTQQGVQDITGAMFILLTSTTVSNMFAVLNAYPVELAVFMREYNSGLYRVDTYYFATSFSEMPHFTILTICFMCICYAMMGFYVSAEAVLLANAILLLVANVVVALGYVIGAMAGTVSVALAAMPVLLVPFLLFGGPMIHPDNVPDYMLPLAYMSWFKWAFEALMINQWKHIDKIECENASPMLCPFHNGDQVLAHMGLDKDNFGTDVMVLLILFGAWRILSFVVLIVKARLSKG